MYLWSSFEEIGYLIHISHDIFFNINMDNIKSIHNALMNLIRVEERIEGKEGFLPEK